MKKLCLALHTLKIMVKWELLVLLFFIMTLLGHVSLNDKTTIVATQIAEKDDGNSSAHVIFTNKICRPSTLHTRTRILRLFLKVGAFILKFFLIVIRVKIFTRSRILKFF